MREDACGDAYSRVRPELIAGRINEGVELCQEDEGRRRNTGGKGQSVEVDLVVTTRSTARYKQRR